MNIADEWSQHRNALDNDSADNLGGVPDIRVCVSPEIPFVFRVTAFFPASSDCGNDGDNHSQAHRQTQTDFLDLAHVQVPGNEPWEGGHNEVHNDVVHWTC